MTPPGIDLVNPDSFVERMPHHWFAELRKNDPVYWHDDPESGVGFWVITKYDDLEYISKHPLKFSSEAKSSLFPEHNEETLKGLRMMMLNQDPPKHREFRSIVSHAFTNKVIEDLSHDIDRRAKTIVGAVAPRGECEFVEDIACKLPHQVICDMMGVGNEQDQRRACELTNVMVGADIRSRSDAQEGLNATLEIYAMGMALAETFRNAPADQNITCRLLNAVVDGKRLTEDEFCRFFFLLLVAGNETARNVTSNGWRVLMEHPEQLQACIEDPSLIPQAVEEILRFEPAVIQFRRTAMENMELRGKQIKKGDKVVIYYASANRDEEKFSDPDRFDIYRDNKDHLTFGIGAHYCLGAHLARLELRSIFREMISRLGNPKLAGPVRRLRSNFINGVKEMRIAFDPETPS